VIRGYGAFINVQKVSPGLLLLVLSNTSDKDVLARRSTSFVSKMQSLAGQAGIILMFSPVNGLLSVNWYIGLSIAKKKVYEASGDFRASAILPL
jgi:hypothetical protein